MSSRSCPACWWWMLLLPLGAAAGWYALRDEVDEHPVPDSRPRAADVPPIAPSPFLNATGAARFVGSAQCAECHPDQHASYLQTAHSLALSEVDPHSEPPDAEFLHRASGRQYHVYRRDGRLWHRESLVPGHQPGRESRQDELAANDYPLRYLVGSGRHSRTYLVEIDGFLVESPITWYASKQNWAMSPGYDQPQHPGFTRAADVGCLVCHAGRVEHAADSVHRLTLHELAIGCESCHGPGSLHVEARLAGTAAEAGNDGTIVHPGRLQRERQEDICAICHLRGDATAFIRGRTLTDFRPGLRLSDFRVDYALSFGDREMKVVGHVEQMRLSRCYTGSETLTCTTCHDPHAPAAAEDRITHYRESCLSCHASESCGVPVETRRRQQPDDNCIACHMPQVPTDIPHIAFTHHRIAIHETAASDSRTAASGPGTLVPLTDTSHLPEIERERLLGLAYLELSDKLADQPGFGAYRDQSRHALGRVRGEGVRDAEVDSALARLVWEEDRLEPAQRLAQSALGRGDASATAQINALIVLGDSALRLEQPARALDAFEQLTRHRRQADDWLLVGICRQELGDRRGAVRAFETAIGIDPFRSDLRQALAELAGGSDTARGAAQRAPEKHEGSGTGPE